MILLITFPVMPAFLSFSLLGYMALKLVWPILMRLPKLCGLPKNMKRLPGLRRSKFQRMPLKNTISIVPLASSTITLILLHFPVRMELSSCGIAEDPGP